MLNLNGLNFGHASLWSWDRVYNKISVVEKFTKPGVDTGDKFGLDSDQFVLHMT